MSNIEIKLVNPEHIVGYVHGNILSDPYGFEPYNTLYKEGETNKVAVKFKQLAEPTIIEGGKCVFKIEIYEKIHDRKHFENEDYIDFCGTITLNLNSNDNYWSTKKKYIYLSLKNAALLLLRWFNLNRWESFYKQSPRIDHKNAFLLYISSPGSIKKVIKEWDITIWEMLARSLYTKDDCPYFNYNNIECQICTEPRSLINRHFNQLLIHGDLYICKICMKKMRNCPLCRCSMEHISHNKLQIVPFTNDIISN